MARLLAWPVSQQGPSCVCRYDAVWHQGTAKCGSYSQVQPAPPGAPGSLPNIELCDPEQVLAEAVAAAATTAAGMAAGFDAATISCELS